MFVDQNIVDRVVVCRAGIGAWLGCAFAAIGAGRHWDRRTLAVFGMAVVSPRKIKILAHCGNTGRGLRTMERVVGTWLGSR